MIGFWTNGIVVLACVIQLTKGEFLHSYLSRLLLGHKLLTVNLQVDPKTGRLVTETKWCRGIPLTVT